MPEDIQTLYAEHRRFDRMIDQLEEHWRIHNADSNRHPDRWIEISEPLQQESGLIYAHMTKEEQLFDRLNQQKNGRLLILAAHEQQRQRVSQYRAELFQCLNDRVHGNGARHTGNLAEALQAYCQGLRAQIAFEERVVFPAVSTLLS